MTSAASLAVTVTLCALAASALFAPTFVFGSSSAGRQSSTETIDTSSVTTGGDATGEQAPADEVVAAAGVPVQTADAGTLLVTLPWGSGPGQVGLVRPQEGLSRGPEALAVSPDGRIAVLDSVNDRVLLLDPSGRVAAAVSVSLTEPRFLAASDSRIYVLDADADRLLLTLRWDGEVLGSTRLPSLPDVVTGLFATQQGPSVEIAHSLVYRITGRGAGKDVAGGDGAGEVKGQGPADAALEAAHGRPLDADAATFVTARFSPGGKPQITSFTTKGGASSSHTALLDLKVPAGRGIEHLVSVDGDSADRVIVGARLANAGGVVDEPCLLLTRFAVHGNGAVSSLGAAGGTADSLLLSDRTLAYVGQPYTVAPDGRVFQPVATEAGVAIFVHTFPAAAAAGQTTEAQS